MVITALERTSGADDAVGALDRDHVTLNHVHHPVRAHSQPVIVATAESFWRLRALGQPGDTYTDGAHPTLIFHVAAG